MTVSTFTKSGSKASSNVKLNPDIFGQKVSDHSLVKSAYQSYLANRRTNNAVTKTRGLVRGGGRKPWRQKGTGRARFGSIRTPIWRGGGITFGPTGVENFKKKLNKKSRQLAIKQALSLKANDNRIAVIESLNIKDKVKQTLALTDKLKQNGKTLFVVEDKDEALDRATRNLKSVNVISAKKLNVYELLNADNVVITKDALKVIDDWLGDKS